MASISRQSGVTQKESRARRLKRRVGVLSERFLINPFVRWVVARRLMRRTFAILETTGRKTGLPRRTPVGYGLDGDVFWLVAGHGRGAGYVRNLQVDPRVRLSLGGQWRTGTASILDDDDARQRLRLLARSYGLARRLDAGILRLVSTDPLTVRIDLDPVAEADT